MKVKTAELSGTALDWAVAVAEGKAPFCLILAKNVWYGGNTGHLQYRPSDKWDFGGPIIEREGISISKRYAPVMRSKHEPPVTDWVSSYFEPPHSALENHRQFGDTPLVAAMRCYVDSKLGSEVDIPEELL